ncbi:cupin domain-containing protein [Bradyrhizobium sp. sBnM-33]|uniref:cupin domain-containing protein n=1 Tax=Bradyrhizobium sp. sBnM-33 TaxID=2831780 RepID=UPI001BD0D3A7|nr:cupin domain-containing protein [Bradyrhizobium sp. sBnM-33]WOH47860.1 cupin domain-containing protein [Bradyrhizobium sp. sBnM-33]
MQSSEPRADEPPGRANARAATSAPGAVVPLHEHTALEQTFMLEGSLEDAEGACRAGDFVWRPGGNIHVAHAPDGATFLAIFNRPNRFFDGTRFFTAGS